MTSCLPASLRSSASRSSAPRCTSACRRASFAAASCSRAAAAARWQPSSCCRRSASPRSRAHCSCSRRLPRASAVLFSSARDSLDSASSRRRRSAASAALQEATGGGSDGGWGLGRAVVAGRPHNASAHSPKVLRLHGGRSAGRAAEVVSAVALRGEDSAEAGGQECVRCETEMRQESDAAKAGLWLHCAAAALPPPHDRSLQPSELCMCGAITGCLLRWLRRIEAGKGTSGERETVGGQGQGSQKRGMGAVTSGEQQRWLESQVAFTAVRAPQHCCGRPAALRMAARTASVPPAAAAA